MSTLEHDILHDFPKALHQNISILYWLQNVLSTIDDGHTVGEIVVFLSGRMV